MYSAAGSNVFFGLQNHDVALVVLCSEYHALGFDAHHFAFLKVENKGAFFARELLWFVPLQEASNGLSLFGPEVNYHSYQVS